MNINLSISLVVLLVGISSCKKNTETQKTTPEATDTLTAGWIKIPVSSRPYGDIFFIDSQTGYLSNGSNDSILKTIDGGLNWTKHPIDTVLKTNGVYNIAATKNGKVFLITKSGYLYKSVNAGLTFSRNTTIPNFSIADVYFANENTGLLATDKGIYKTIDGANTWSLVSNLLTGTSISMFDSTNAWVCNYSTPNMNYIIHANGNLNSFRSDTLPRYNPSLSPSPISLCAVSSTTVFVGDLGGHLFKTTDGGYTWIDLGTSPISGIVDIHFVDANVGYISGGNVICKTTNGGNTWIVVVYLVDNQIGELHFTDANHGWADCNKKFILKYN